jgi:hypothetical protein
VTSGISASYNGGMKPPLLAALFAAVALAVAGCAGSHPSSVHGAPPPPSKTEMRLFARWMLRQARAWGDPRPTNGVVVPTTQKAALRLQYGATATKATPGAPVYVVLAHGRFTANDVPRPRGAASPTGTVIELTYDAKTNRLREVGLLHKIRNVNRAGKPEPLPLADPPAAVSVRYQLEGITFAAAPPGYRPGVSRARVLTLFRKSGLLGSDAQSRPAVQLWTVGDGRPADGGSASWVLTFRHTIPTSLGVPKTPVCTTVAIYDLSARVWTWDFQNCGEGKRASCDAGCTPANQSALDAAATYAETVTGASHVYAGDRVDDAANQVVVYLVHAPGSVLAELRTRHPGIYVIHNDAPRTWHAVTQLQKSLDWRALKAKGIDIVSSGPTGTGYLQVGVSSSVAKAQAFFDAKYGRGVVRVEHAEPVILDDGGPVLKHPIHGAVAVRSTRSQEANAAEVRQWRKRPIAVFTNGDASVVRFVVLGDGCKPAATAARIAGTTLTLLMRRGSGCTLIGRFYEVTVSLAKPVLGQGLRDVVVRYGTSGKPQQMRLTEVVYG